MASNLTSYEFKEIYVRRIASGEWESRILKDLDWEWIDFHELCAEDPEFRRKIDEARKGRAEKWVERIAGSMNPMREDEFGEMVPVPIAPSEVPILKLEFEKLKFLAQADNPERYSPTGKPSKVDVNIDLNQFKLLTPQESMKVLASDPFSRVTMVDGVEVQAKKEDKDE